MYKLENLQNIDVQAEIDGEWVPARPLNWQYRSLKQRIKEAYAVFTGKADAFIWPKGQ